MNDEKLLTVEDVVAKFPDGHPAKAATRLVVCTRGSALTIPYRPPCRSVFTAADDLIPTSEWFRETVAPEVWSDGIGYGYGPETNCVVVFQGSD